jgi:hypothetical protein
MTDGDNHPAQEITDHDRGGDRRLFWSGRKNVIPRGAWIGLGIGLFLAAGFTAAFLLDATTRQKLVAKFLGPDQSQWSDIPAGRELTSAMGQHFFIAAPISRCFPEADITRRNVSSTVFATLMLGLQPLGNHQWESIGEFPKGDPEPSLKLTNFQMSVLVLSDSISRARMRSAEGATLNQSRMELYQWVLVLLGALTTIFISLKSILNERTPGFVAVGIFAVIFSALSTACSSLISFYTPTDAFVRNDRSLSQLRQLHNDLAFYVAGIADICAPALGDTDNAKKSLKDLSVRLTEITNASGGSTQSGQNPSGASGQTGAGSSTLIR